MFVNTRGAIVTVFTYIYYLLIEKNICDCRKATVKLPCVSLSSGDFSIFFGMSFLLLFLFLILKMSDIKHREDLQDQKVWCSRLMLLGRQILINAALIVKQIC